MNSFPFWGVEIGNPPPQLLEKNNYFRKHSLSSFLIVNAYLILTQIAKWFIIHLLRQHEI